MSDVLLVVGVAAIIAGFCILLCSALLLLAFMQKMRKEYLASVRSIARVTNYVMALKEANRTQRVEGPRVPSYTDLMDSFSEQELEEMQKESGVTVEEA